MNKVTWGAINGKNDSAANLKAWIQALHDNLIASGLVQTADTGQLSISGISAVLLSGSYLAPLIYRFDDSLAGSSPVIIKLRPYAGYMGGGGPFGNVAISIGTGTDGAGNLAGANTGEFNFYNSGGGSAASIQSVETLSYAIHSEGRFGLCFGIGALSSTANSFCNAFLDIARTTGGIAITRNAAAYDSGGTIAPSAMRIRKGYLHSVFNGWRQDLCYWAGGSDAATSAGSVQMQRTYRTAPSLEPDPSIALYWLSGVTAGDQFDLSVDGVTRNYVALGGNTSLGVDPVTNTNVVGIALLWDDL